MNWYSALISLMASSALCADLYIIDTTSGAGDSGAVGGRKINGNFTNIQQGTVLLSNTPLYTPYISAGLLTNGTQLRGGIIDTGYMQGTTVSNAIVYNTRLVSGTTNNYLKTLFVNDLLVTNISNLGTNDFTINSTNILYVMESGNDASAVRGNPARPWRTMTNAFKYMTNNGMTMSVGPGIYYISPITSNESQILIAGSKVVSHAQLTDVTNVSIIGSGPSTKVILTGYGNGFSLCNVSNFLFQDMWIQGPGKSELPFAAYFGAILMRGWPEAPYACGHGTFRRLTLDGCSEHGITFLYPGRLAHDILIEDCTFQNIGCTNHLTLDWDGAAISGIGSRWVIRNNKFFNNLRDVEVESYSGGSLISDVLAENNIHNKTWNIPYMVNSPVSTMAEIKNIVFRNNIVSNVLAYTNTENYGANAFIVDGGENIQITGNIIDNVVSYSSAQGASYGININAERSHIKNVIIANNIIKAVQAHSITVSTNSNGVRLNGVTNVLISGNIISEPDPQTYGSAYAAIAVGGSGITVSDNKFFNASGWPSNLQGAVVTTNYSCLIKVRTGSSGVSVDDNMQIENRAVALYHPDHGLYIEPNATNVRYSGNIFTTYRVRPITNASAAIGLPSMFYSTNVPSNTLDAAPPGSMYLNTAATANSLYVIGTDGEWGISSGGTNLLDMAGIYTWTGTNVYLGSNYFSTMNMDSLNVTNLDIRSTGAGYDGYFHNTGTNFSAEVWATNGIKLGIGATNWISSWYQLTNGLGAGGSAGHTNIVETYGVADQTLQMTNAYSPSTLAGSNVNMVVSGDLTVYGTGGITTKGAADSGVIEVDGRVIYTPVNRGVTGISAADFGTYTVGWNSTNFLMMNTNGHMSLFMYDGTNIGHKFLWP